MLQHIEVKTMNSTRRDAGRALSPWAVAVLFGLLIAAGPAAAQTGPLLGAPDFKPSAERPVGWRGDRTGRFPAATPPTHWGRRVKSFVTDLTCQAGKPAGNAAGGVPLDLGAPGQWLVAGPFPVEEVTKDLAAQPVADEDRLVAEQGAKVGAAAWQPAVVNITTQCHDYARLTVDFAFVYDLREQTEWQNHPGTLEPLIGYAHTYIYSKESGKARFAYQADGFADCWLNGKPTLPGEVELNKGWNRLLAKVGSSRRAWHFNCRFAPLPPYEYETENVAWMTHMPGGGWSSPIVVGDRIFVAADYCNLVCINKADGRILWVRPLTFYDALTEQQRKETPALVETVGPLAAQRDALNDEIVARINANLGPGGIPYAQQAALTAKIRQKNELEIKIHREMRRLDRKKFPNPDQHCGGANATPCSDGKLVWAAMLGGCKGVGGNTLGCFDLDGNVQWTFFTPCGAPEHGNHASPLLAGDKLVYSAMTTTWAFQKDTGRPLWQYKVDHWGYAGASPLLAKAGDTDVVIDPCGEVVRLSDGKGLWSDWQFQGYAFNSGTVVDNVFYQSTMWDPPKAYAMKFPAPDGDKLKPDVVFKVTGKEIHCPQLKTTFANSHVPSILCHDGLMYLVTEGGGLSVFDAQTGQKLYSKVLDLTPRLTWVFTVGVCSSPTLAGGYIYITDDQSQTIIFAPGKEYRQVARNALVNLNPDQEQSQSTPFFEGARMYYRSQNYLYCIGGK